MHYVIHCYALLRKLIKERSVENWRGFIIVHTMYIREFHESENSFVRGKLRRIVQEIHHNHRQSTLSLTCHTH